MSEAGKILIIGAFTKKRKKDEKIQNFKLSILLEI